MKLIRFLLALAVMLALGAAAFGFWVQSQLNGTIVVPECARHFKIPRGERVDETVNRLVAAGVLKQALPLRLYMKIAKIRPVIKAGNYTFPSPVSPLGVLSKLEAGGDFSRLTVVEGWTRWDIAAAMCRVPDLKLKDANAALVLMSNTRQIKAIDPEAPNLEGYLYPDTYFIAPDSTASELIDEMVRHFKDVWQKDLSQAASTANLSPHALVTVASIVETEAKLKEERPIIASVIYNRIRRHIPLAMDSTVVYASKLVGKWKNNGKVYQSDIDRRSPYNTRQVYGLPPGPVGSPGGSSLKAAIAPAKTTYIFYVREPSRNDGAHNFYDNAADFEAGVQALRLWEKKRDAAAAAQGKKAHKP